MMKSIRWAALFAVWALFAARAYPPAPHHLLYGQARDEFGNPLIVEGARVVLETEDGTTRLSAPIEGGVVPGVNYRLAIPMDSGVTADKYQPTAMRPRLPFLIHVVVEGERYLPIELKGNFLRLGQPGKSTRLDLTLGEDADGDGLPDAWERALGEDEVNPNDDADGDGLSNLEEYLAGSYAFDPKDGFYLDPAGEVEGHFAVEFLALRGRTYTVVGSANLKDWTTMELQLAPEDDSEGALSEEWAGGVYTEDTLRLKVVLNSSGVSAGFFKLIVQ